MNILIIDDDQLVSASLKIILESEPDIRVVGLGNSGNAGVSLYKKLKPDILLMDIRMDHMSGLDAAELIMKDDPDAKILFLTTFSDDEYIVKAFQIGAKGYILKQNYESIIPSLKAVHVGQRVFGDEIINKMPAFQSSRKPQSLGRFDLNEKEVEIITHVAGGLSNKEISETLFLSEGTIRNYISVILEKLHLRDRTQLAIFYYKNT